MLPIKALLIATTAFAMTACGTTAGNYRPIVDGQETAKYESDLNACKTLAEKRSYTNDDVKSEATMAAVVGAAVGAIEGGSGGAIGGAIAGGLLGAGGRAWDTREERKDIVIECMKLRDHKVVG